MFIYYNDEWNEEGEKETKRGNSNLSRMVRCSTYTNTGTK